MRLFVCLLAVLLAGCGFHLRGLNASQPLAFSTLYLNPANPALSDILRQSLMLQPNLKLAPAAQGADAELRIESESIEEQVLTVNRSGRVAEYQLTYRTSFSLRSGERSLIAPSSLIVRRDLSFDETKVLSKEAEKAVLIRDMRNDAAQQILRRLAAVRP
ncbi:LPS-assembly lipoprotein LptE [Parachitinimonas caeni]|uniref:LPS-assembly lipoprotein LptE n=1 Tax=Parachitinimonas caeni TaxID=3031301 RepID=A0ABT7DQZ0_9NEIS|nr:LPS assembly lipoprotein LptE [Parachitinimonas caeni]MDK2122495.1 LPS assembly lipoprotein LptE [Parachitinimonas caeni]